MSASGIDARRALGARMMALPGVAGALALLGTAVIAAEPITALVVPGSPRFAFRARLADGRVVKVRRVKRPGKAARGWRYVQGLRDPPFPRVLVRIGEILIEEWVDGTPLGHATPAATDLAAAARLLARLHRVPLDVRAPARRRATMDLARATLVRLAALRERRLLGDEATDRLADAARRHVPADARIGVTHNDLCGENLVVDATGALRVIDNETVDVGFVDYDLARTWYRWRLDAAAWTSFIAAYVTAGGAEPAARNLPFWRIAAVAKSAAVRAAASPADLEVALERLRELAEPR